ncbi:DUF58 domain-containing protein [Megasphaera paucivorans]|uniref:DUF58 domain-containing protein n=1 Tax=Megasphaera paucivorans TaxID=349095 RepID=A0A1G9YN28_9FIRM|nr:DUF58 domain-containing protein [Megasphaera paucivorans]SDN10452.1 Protein of unknown function DUF58 [Megasphaera paucivorans]
MTWPRLIYILTFFFTACLYFLYDQYEAFLLFALTCSIPVLSWVLLCMEKKFITIDFDNELATVVCGEDIHVPIKIKNRFYVSAADISIRILEKEKSGKILEDTLFFINSFIYSTNTMVYTYHMTCCGRMEIYIDSVIFQDLLHLFSYKRKVPGSYVVLVMPQLWQGTDDINVCGTVLAATGTAGELAGIKLYRPGDNSRYIHWKASAAHDDVYMREFYAQQEADIVLLFDIPFQADEKVCNAVYEVFYAVGVRLISLYGGFVFSYRQENDVLYTKHIHYRADLDQQLTAYMCADRMEGTLSNLHRFVESGRKNYRCIFYISAASENEIMDISGDLYSLMTFFIVGNRESNVYGDKVIYIDPANVAGSLAEVWHI